MRGTGVTLSEAGPRLCLHPIKIFAGAFGGPTLYDDPTYVSPNVQRREEKKKDQGKYQRKIQKKAERKAHARMNALKPGRTGRLERVRGIEGRSVTRARFGCDETRTCRVPRERLRS